MKNAHLKLLSVERHGWLWWTVRWRSSDDWQGGGITGSPWYVLRRLAEWLEP